MKITLTRYEESHIRTFTYAYAHSLNVTLKAAKAALLSELEPDYAYRIFLLHFRTGLGDPQSYWHPLFDEMEKLLKERLDIIDHGALWDAILPVGSETLEKIRARIRNHKGPFEFPIPDLYEWKPASTVQEA